MQSILTSKPGGTLATFRGNLKEYQRAYERATSAILASVLQLQASTIFYETYCNLIVFFDHAADSLLNAQVLYARGKKPGDYSEIDYDRLHAICNVN
mmetsp:Transcript_14690/g.27890  ORF Transcript_14690/g.27890 Transcript_14690/m.27890 type:complete len:97 (+) Transcript_14690:158-448(+)